jgi:hypothetical protein
LALQFVGGQQEVGSCSGPLIPVDHDITRAGGHWVSLDNAFNDGLAIGSLGAGDSVGLYFSDLDCLVLQELYAKRATHCKHLKQSLTPTVATSRSLLRMLPISTERLHNLDAARAAYGACRTNYPTKLLYLSQDGLILLRSGRVEAEVRPL